MLPFRRGVYLVASFLLVRVFFVQNAALIALEGERNEKLSWHPSGSHRRWKLLAYKLHHNPFFYTLCLVDTIVLMGLAAVEETPADRHDSLNQYSLILSVRSTNYFTNA